MRLRPSRSGAVSVACRLLRIYIIDDFLFLCLRALTPLGALSPCRRRTNRSRFGHSDNLMRSRVQFSARAIRNFSFCSFPREIEIEIEIEAGIEREKEITL
jgi:hypothetical protein